MSSSSTQKQQQQQQQQRRRINNNNSQQSRNTNAYFDRTEYHQRSLINNNNYYWNHDYQRSNEDFYMNDHYQHRNIYPISSQSIRKGRQIKNEQRYNSKSVFSSSSSNNNRSYYDNIPPRHRLQQQIDKREQNSSRLQESRTNNRLDNSLINNEKPIKPLQSTSSSSTNSNISNNPGSTNRKDLHTKNLAAAAIAARQQNSQPQTNLGIVQALMNSLILQQQQQQPSSQSQSTIQLQYQLTNALLATSKLKIITKKYSFFFYNLVIQQRLKETALQAQAQQIQAALPTLLAAQALVYQQQQQLTTAQSILPHNVAHPGTKFNNRPLVKFPIIRPTISPLPPTMMTPIIRPSVTTNFSRHRIGTNIQQTCSTTILPTYQQVQEIERGISLDEAIHLKGAIDIADINNNSNTDEIEATCINNNITE